MEERDLVIGGGGVSGVFPVVTGAEHKKPITMLHGPKYFMADILPRFHFDNVEYDVLAQQQALQSFRFLSVRDWTKRGRHAFWILNGRRERRVSRVVCTAWSRANSRRWAHLP